MIFQFYWCIWVDKIPAKAGVSKIKTYMFHVERSS